MSKEETENDPIVKTLIGIILAVTFGSIVSVVWHCYTNLQEAEERVYGKPMTTISTPEAVNQRESIK